MIFQNRLYNLKNWSSVSCLTVMHCSNKTIFCKQVEDVCPICDQTISDYALEPFRLPNHFIKASDSPVSVVIRPSSGTFVSDYVVADDLHIGIVDSTGVIVEFDKQGITRNDFSNWQNCLTLKIVPEAWNDHWDQTIETICGEERWSARYYNEYNFNCFNFVLEYLKQLNYKELKFTNKEDFCSNFIIPKIQDALKYVSIYRKLSNANYFITN